MKTLTSATYQGHKKGLPFKADYIAQITLSSINYPLQ